MKKTININAVAYQDGESWIVQGIQYDLVALARRVQDIPAAFANAIIERMHVADHLGLDDPFLGVAPAHDRFHKMFDAAVTEVQSAQALGRTTTPGVRLASVEAVAA